MEINKTHTWAFAVGSITGSVITGLCMLSVIFYLTQPEFKAVTVENAKLVAGETRAQCEKIKARNFKLEADGLRVAGGCAK